jgi:hypothetical protein
MGRNLDLTESGFSGDAEASLQNKLESAGRGSDPYPHGDLCSRCGMGLIHTVWCRDGGAAMIHCSHCGSVKVWDTGRVGIFCALAMIVLALVGTFLLR